MDTKTREYFERRVQEEADKAKAASTAAVAATHRELEQLYRAKLDSGTDTLAIVADG